MVIKQSKRNVLSRLFNAKDDKEAIAAWRLDLNRILHVFNVRSIASSPPLLTIRFQTELAINTHVAVSGILQEVTDTHNIVSDIQRTMGKQQQGADGTSPSVSDRCALLIKRLMLPRRKLGSNFTPPIIPISNV